MKSVQLIMVASAVCVLNSSAETVYPLKAIPGQHFLSDQTGAPFFIQGDSPRFLTEALRGAEVDYYLSNRKDTNPSFSTLRRKRTMTFSRTKEHLRTTSLHQHDKGAVY